MVTVPQSMNRYAYVMNNPTRFVDPSGAVWGDPAEHKGVLADSINNEKDPTTRFIAGVTYSTVWWASFGTADNIDASTDQYCKGGLTTEQYIHDVGVQSSVGVARAATIGVGAGRDGC